jgi:hypothetical protein
LENTVMTKALTVAALVVATVVATPALMSGVTDRGVSESQRSIAANGTGGTGDLARRGTREPLAQDPDALFETSTLPRRGSRAELELADSVAFATDETPRRGNR